MSGHELWVGTWQGGINILDAKRQNFRQIGADNPNLRSVFKLMRDSKGNVWASTYLVDLQNLI